MLSKSMLDFQSEVLLAQLQEKGVSWLNKIEIFPSIKSSNTYLLNLSAAHGRVCIADYQTHGKGRRGKRWQSRPGESLMFSLGWTPKTPHFGELSLVIGVALAEVLQRLGVENIELKWPNDLMVNGAKLAGILVESRFRNKQMEMVIGVGLNFAFKQAATNAIPTPWIDIKRLGLTSLSRSQLLVLILTRLSLRLADYERAGFKVLREKWLSFFADMGSEVSFVHHTESRIGKIVGLDAKGSLVIEYAGEMLSVNSGEVHTIRRRV